MNIRYDKLKDKILYFIAFLYFILLIYFHANKYIFSFDESISAITVGFDNEINSLIRYNECGELVGFSVDFITSFLKKMFISFDFKKINKSKHRLFQYKIILHAKRDDPKYHNFFFSKPLFTSYRFIVIAKKGIVLSKPESLASMTTLKGNVLYYFAQNKENYEFVDSFDICYTSLKNAKIIILEKDVWLQFKKYIDYEKNNKKYKIVEVSIPIQPICIAVFYDSAFLLHAINNYIEKFMRGEHYENSI